MVRGDGRGGLDLVPRVLGAAGERDVGDRRLTIELLVEQPTGTEVPQTVLDEEPAQGRLVDIRGLVGPSVPVLRLLGPGGVVGGGAERSETSLPPDLVMVFTTPPANRPYSADTLAVEVVVSWMASSMNTLVAWPRMFSLTTTPFTRYRFSYDCAPEICAPLTPAVTPGAIDT